MTLGEQWSGGHDRRDGDRLRRRVRDAADDRQDAMARCIRALDAMRDGDSELADQILDDLVSDLWNVVERESLR